MADKPSNPSGLGAFLALMLILFILWVISGGPSRDQESRSNQFIEPIGVNGHNGETYHDSVFGQPGSVTNKIPFFK
jgi:hypothetical protein